MIRAEFLMTIVFERQLLPQWPNVRIVPDRGLPTAGVECRAPKSIVSEIHDFLRQHRVHLASSVSQYYLSKPSSQNFCLVMSFEKRVKKLTSAET